MWSCFWATECRMRTQEVWDWKLGWGVRRGRWGGGGGGMGWVGWGDLHYQPAALEDALFGE